MYYFTGSNFFGQWYGCTENIIDHFITFPEDKKTACDFSIKCAKLVHIGWSHNIFQYNNEFYIVGDFKCSGQPLDVVCLPKECSDCSNVTVVSDDYRLAIIKKDTCTYWSVDMESKHMKVLKLTTEVPLKGASKKLKKEDTIIKCVAANGTLMFLTSENLVYTGLLPNLVDTSHCVGKPIDIQCGYEHNLLLTDVGRVYTWGNGWRLQLGHGDVSIVDTPTEIEALAGIKIIKIAAGGWHSLALSEFGDLYAWGWNDAGQLGVKENLNKDTIQSYALPTLVDLFDDNDSVVDVNIIDIACGSRHSAVLLDDDSVWTTGNNKYGQLGVSTKNSLSVDHFKKSFSLEFASRLMCGQWSTVVVKKEDKLEFQADLK